MDEQLKKEFLKQYDRDQGSNVSDYEFPPDLDRILTSFRRAKDGTIKSEFSVDLNDQTAVEKKLDSNLFTLMRVEWTTPQIPRIPKSFWYESLNKYIGIKRARWLIISNDSLNDIDALIDENGLESVRQLLLTLILSIQERVYLNQDTSSIKKYDKLLSKTLESLQSLRKVLNESNEFKLDYELDDSIMVNVVQSNPLNEEPLLQVPGTIEFKLRKRGNKQIIQCPYVKSDLMRSIASSFEERGIRLQEDTLDLKLTERYLREQTNLFIPTETIIKELGLILYRIIVELGGYNKNGLKVTSALSRLIYSFMDCALINVGRELSIDSTDYRRVKYIARPIRRYLKKK